MVTMYIKTIILTTAVVIFGAMLAIRVDASDAAPVKLVQQAHISGFEHPEGIAVAPDGDIYVADRGNSRIQELTPNGELVLMFGWDVNKTKVEASAPQPERNVCTAASHDVCQAGIKGTAAGQFAEAFSLAVDPSSGDVYVQEARVDNFRVDKYTGEGQFVWMIGKEVNATTSGNICTAASGDVCQAGLESSIGSNEPAAFKFEILRGNVIAFGGPEKLLYVGDEQRVQEFDTEGVLRGEIDPTAFDAGTTCSVLQQGCLITALTVDPVGNVYLTYRVSAFLEPARIRVFAPNGKEEGFEARSNTPGDEVKIKGIAIDASDRLAVSAREAAGSVGLLYETGEHLGHLITKFAIPAISNGVTFDDTAGPQSGDLYASVGDEIVVYTPVFVSELIPKPMTCESGIPHETDLTLDCTLNGEVNPEGVTKTEVWFEWGRTAGLGEKTPSQEIPDGVTATAVSAKVGTVRPNEASFYYRLAGYDQNVEPPEEALTSEEISFPTPIVAPVIVGEPTAAFIQSSSAVVVGELNPENAKTQYFFEYGPPAALEKCPGVKNATCPEVSVTATRESSLYAKIRTTIEAKELRADTLYGIRMFAESESDAKTEKLHNIGPEGEFTTAPAPTVQAETDLPGAVTSTSAVIVGSVAPDGQPATYTFEIGVDAGPRTQYGVVFSGETGAGTTPVAESYLVTGLQPGTTYAYRIKIASGYGTATGQPRAFTTSGQPAVIGTPTAVAMLALPRIAFPTIVKPRPKCKPHHIRDKRGKCVKVKRSNKTRTSQGKGARKKSKR